MTGHPHDHAPAAGRLTPIRRAVLDALKAAPGPRGAYDLADALGAAAGRRIAPVTVYRALDFLVEHGFVHRLASRNAYLPCPHRHGPEEAVTFLICEGCGRAEEVEAGEVAAALTAAAGARGFTPHHQMVEVSGLCAACGAGT